MYDYINDVEKMVIILQEYLEDYNALSTAQMKLVLFLDAVCHVTRISRVIRCAEFPLFYSQYISNLSPNNLIRCELLCVPVYY